MNENRTEAAIGTLRVPWNKGELIGQKPPLTLKEIWAVRIRLQIANRVRDLAVFNLAIGSKLRGCDLVRLRVWDVVHGERIVSRATVIQRKTGQPVRFELTEQTRVALQALNSRGCNQSNRSHRQRHSNPAHAAVVTIEQDPESSGVY